MCVYVCLFVCQKYTSYTFGMIAKNVPVGHQFFGYFPVLLVKFPPSSMPTLSYFVIPHFLGILIIYYFGNLLFFFSKNFYSSKSNERYNNNNNKFGVISLLF